MKKKVKDVDDLDENWLANIPCQNAHAFKNVLLLGSELFFAVHNRTLRGRTYGSTNGRTHTLVTE